MPMQVESPICSVQGVVHRSLRPDNLLFYEPDQRWRIFGMARWARSGTDAPLVYNLRYTGPEVCWFAGVPQP